MSSTSSVPGKRYDGLNVDFVDDADNGGIDGSRFVIDRFAGCAATRDQDLLAHSGANRVNRHIGLAFRNKSFRIQGLNYLDLAANQPLMLASGNHRSDDLSDFHDIPL